LKKNKTIYRIFIITIFILLNAAVIYGISQVIAYLNTGADSSKILHLDIERTDYYLPEVTWVSIDNPGRPLETENQKKIEQDYLDAWYVKSLGLENNNMDGIYDHFTKSARKKVNDLIAYNTAHKIAIRSTTLNHHITLDFYSADGTVAILTDRRVSGMEKIYINNEFITHREFNEDYRVILLLQDGFWRIRHFEKLAVHKIAAIKNIIPAELNQIKGLNYYPEKYPWDTFNINVTAQTFAADFKIIQNLDLNTIRIFIGYEDFGKANIDVTKLEKLHLLLDEAQKANLKVMITLFDFYGNYDIKNWTLTNQHLKALLIGVRDHPALLAWDIKNEPNLDFANRDKEQVLSWLSQTIKAVKKLDSIHPVTIGWSSHKAALNLKDEVDFISYHYYQDLENLSKVHNSLKQGTSKPIVLQEIGLSSYDGFWSFGGKDKEDQAAFYKALLKTQKRDSINYLFWTLYDFDKIPNDVAGQLPWRKNKQAYFGIIDSTGVKPAYILIKNN